MIFFSIKTKFETRFEKSFLSENTKPWFSFSLTRVVTFNQKKFSPVSSLRETFRKIITSMKTSKHRIFKKNSKKSVINSEN